MLARKTERDACRSSFHLCSDRCRNSNPYLHDVMESHLFSSTYQGFRRMENYSTQIMKMIVEVSWVISGKTNREDCCARESWRASVVGVRDLSALDCQVISSFRILKELADVLNVTASTPAREAPSQESSAYRSWYLGICGQMNGTFRSCVVLVDASDGINFLSHHRSFSRSGGWRQWGRDGDLLASPSFAHNNFPFV